MELVSYLDVRGPACSGKTFLATCLRELGYTLTWKDLPDHVSDRELYEVKTPPDTLRTAVGGFGVMSSKKNNTVLVQFTGEHWAQ